MFWMRYWENHLANIEKRLTRVPRRLVILASCGFARSVEHLLSDQRPRDAIETTERYADGLATEGELEEARKAAGAAKAAVEVGV